MSDIFISYSSKDRDRAKVLAGALESQGLSVWWDRKIPPGKQFSKVIKEAMDEAKCIIVLWSKESVKSEWVQNEASEGAQRKILVPALIDDVEIPFEFRRIQAARLVDWDGKSPHPEFDTLLEAVRAITGQPLSPQQESEEPPRAAYTITSSAGAGGAISPSGEVSVNSGADQSFSITSEDGYQIADVVVDGNSVGAVASHTFTNVTADHTIDVSFAIKTYSLIVTDSPKGSITKSPDKTRYNHGETVTLKAIPKTGYSFVNWSGDLSGRTNPTMLVMNADKSVTASFIVNVLNYIKSTGTEIQKRWSKRQKTIALAAICIVALIVIVSIAVFPKKKKDSQPKTYSLDIPHAVGGYVKKDPNQASYNKGETVTLEAVADAKYTFTGWSGDLAGSNNPATLVMDADKAVTASFTLTYSLNATAGAGGAISPSGVVPVNSGADRTFAMTSEAGYQIADVLVDGVSIGAVASYTFTNVTADHTIEASFTVAAHTITASAGAGGEISPSGEVSVNSGVDKTFAMTSEAGYKIADVLVDGVSIGAVASYTFTNVTANHTIDASFTVAVRPVAAYTITASAGAEGTINPSGKVPVNSGDDKSFSITPEAGYKIVDVVVDGNSVSAVASYTFTNVTADHTIDASFTVAACTITASAGAGGAISPSGKVLVSLGDDKSFTMTPEAGYQTADVLVDGVSIGAVASYTFTNVTADHTIEASFAALKAPDVITDSIGMKLVYIPAGEFMMGSSDTAIQLAGEYNISEEEFTDEFPQHKVRISKGFWMGQTEVTQGQYESVMNAQPWSGRPWVEEDANNPAVYVSWDKAVEFCRKLSQLEGKTYRLPTEAEWEYACRADTTTRFSCGDSVLYLGDHALFWDNTYKEGRDYAHSVGQKKANPWSLYDMHGNVREWCGDWYAKDYYSSSPSVDPNGPSSGATRSLRGGSWANTGVYLRCSCRDGYDPDDVRSSVGFRVVCEQ